MINASVYYNKRTGDPHFVVINGDRSDVIDTGGVMGGEWKLRDVNEACRRLGWEVMGDAKIVRQADGRGTVAVEPVRDDIPDQAKIGVTAEEEIRDGGLAHIVLSSGGVPRFVHADGRTHKVNTLCQLTSPLVTNRERAVDAVDEALGKLGFRRTSAFEVSTTGPGLQYTCTVGIDEHEPEADDWRDAVTLVRMDDNTADLLTRTASMLDIPADQLASTWISRAARSALLNYEWFTDDRNHVDQTKIAGWLHDGTPKPKG